VCEGRTGEISVGDSVKVEVDSLIQEGVKDFIDMGNLILEILHPKKKINILDCHL